LPPQSLLPNARAVCPDAHLLTQMCKSGGDPGFSCTSNVQFSVELT
jgi:hypothetical protein